MNPKLIMRAIELKLMLNRLSKAKENAMREFLGLPPKLSWWDECTGGISMWVREKICFIFCPCCIYDIDRKKKRMSCLNTTTFRHFIGFLGGLFLTLMAFFIMIYQGEMDAHLTGMICVAGGFVVTMAMAFCLPIRCFMLLMIPQLFSGKGRMFLLMYGLFLVMNHPVRNVHKNVTIMSQSTTCGQEMAMNQTKELVKAATAPMAAIINSIEKVLGKLKIFANFLRSTYAGLKRCVAEIGSVIDRAVRWLKSMSLRCNERMGSPYRKCRKLFDNAVQRCEDMGFWILCEIPAGFSWLCNIVRVGELLCLIVDAIQALLENAVARPAQRLLASAREMFFFNVTMNFHFNYTITQSKSYKEVKDAINDEIEKRMDAFTRAVGIVNNVMFVTFAFIAIKAFIYRYRWLTDDRFDNIYVTFTVLDLEERRTVARKKGIMPLLFEEQLRYVESLDWRMVMGEVRRLAAGFVFFLLSVFNAGFYLFCDYGLYSVLALIKKHFKVIKDAPTPPHTKLQVIGDGPMADIYRSLVTMFDPISSSSVKLDVTQCVPIPSEPNWSIYKQIGIIYFVCLILLITEAYGLRLRHILMACYYPKRDRKRALWLFNHIMKTRGPLMDHVKNRIKNQKGALNVANVSVKGRLAASFPFLERLFKFCGWERKNCLYCGREGKPDDYTNFIHCAFVDCDGTYCVDCYADLNNVCAICNNAVELTASASEELDSSLSSVERQVKKIQKKVRDKKIQHIQKARDPTKVFGDFKSTVGYQEGNTLEEVLGDTGDTAEGGSDTSKTNLEGDTDGSDRDKSIDETESVTLHDDTASTELTNNKTGSHDETNISQNNEHVLLIDDSDSEDETTFQSRSVDSEHESSDEEIIERRYRNRQNNAVPYRSRMPYVEKLNHPSLLRRRLNVGSGNTSSNAVSFNQAPVETDSDTDMEDLISVSSVDTADLDFDYQSQKDMDSDYSSDDGLTRRRASRNLDLATYDIFGSSGEESDSKESDDDFSDDSELMAPDEIVISRE